MRKYLLTFACILLCWVASAQPKPIKLWSDVPGMKQMPSKLYIYPAPKENNTGIAVVVCPGGSYSHTMGIAVEGFEVAEWLNSMGISAFVLKYRVGSQLYHHPAMIQDAQYAIHYVKKHAAEYGIDPAKVGTMGFSAGGHLVTMTGAFYKDNYIQDLGVVDNISLKPAFVVPVYPVVSMQDSIAHKRSRRNLLSLQYNEGQRNRFSMEQSIPKDMPPVFLVTAIDDPVVMYQNSVVLDQALTQAGIKHRFMLYKTGGHGYGLSETIAPEAGKWKYEFIKWLKTVIN